MSVIVSIILEKNSYDKMFFFLMIFSLLQQRRTRAYRAGATDRRAESDRTYRKRKTTLGDRRKATTRTTKVLLVVFLSQKCVLFTGVKFKKRSTRKRIISSGRTPNSNTRAILSRLVLSLGEMNVFLHARRPFVHVNACLMCKDA